MGGQKIRIALGLGLALLCLGSAARAAVDPRAQAVVDGVARLFVSQSCTATMAMEISQADGQRTIALRFQSLGASDVLIRILGPPEDAGTAILKLGDKAWMYLAKSQRTVAMPESMMMTSWMGGQFTLNDLVGESRLGSDYVIAAVVSGSRNGIAVADYTLTPKPDAAVVWSKIILEIRQSDQMPVWQRYYDDDGIEVRNLSFFDYKTMGGRLIPTRLVMRPADQAVERTTITYHTIVFDAPISAAIFSLRNFMK